MGKRSARGKIDTRAVERASTTAAISERHELGPKQQRPAGYSQDLSDARSEIARRWLHRNLRIDHDRSRRTRLVRRVKVLAGGNVHAVGIAQKVTAGAPTGVLAVQVCVAQKFAKRLLGRDMRIPERIAGLPTDVIEVPLHRAASAGPAGMALPILRGRNRPLAAGSSAANREVLAGTLGWFCRSLRPGDPPGATYALSCRHVFAPDGDADLNVKLYQPSSNDGARQADWFANVARYSMLRPRSKRAQATDAAIGIVRAGLAIDPILHPFGQISGVGVAIEGDIVAKVGRTTGVTTGVVNTIDCEACVPVEGVGTVLFRDQIRIVGSVAHPVFALPGDSGALVLAPSSTRAVGLLFATSAMGDSALMNDISAVLEDLEIVLL